MGFYALVSGVWIVGGILLLFGIMFGWHLMRHRKTEWVIFNGADGGRVVFTRQGPDAEKCDWFTNRLVTAIRSARHEQNDQM